MTLIELLCEGLLVVGNPFLKLLGGDVNVVYLDVEILTGREGVVFLLDLVVGDDDGEIINRLAAVEGSDDFVHIIL